MNKRFLSIVQDTMAQYDMLQSGQTVLCAVSGGADSVALLRALCTLQETMHIAVCACHVEHGIRGEEAQRDADFAQQLFESLQVPYRIVHCDVPAEAQKRGIGWEEAARILRYAALQETADALHAQKIATAHTLDDNLETMLFHLARGAGAKGLGGIPPTRGQIIRPLLGVTREQIEAYLQTLSQAFVTDSTNLSNAYTRNRIRHEIVPILRQINPKCAQAAGRAAQSLREDASYLETCAAQRGKQIAKQTENGLQISVSAFADTPKPLQTRMLFQFLQQSGIPAIRCDAALIARLQAFLLQTQTAKIQLVQNFVAIRQQNQVRIVQETPQIQIAEIPVWLGFSAKIAGTSSKVTLSKCRIRPDFNKKFNTFYADCGKIHFETLHIRTRRQGDRIQLAEKSGHASLKKRMQDYQIPQEKRNEILLLADKNGIIAVQSMGTDYSRWVQSDNTDILKIEFEGE